MEWLGRDGQVLARSDAHNREAFLLHRAQHRTPRIAAHRAGLLQPLAADHSQAAPAPTPTQQSPAAHQTPCPLPSTLWPTLKPATATIASGPRAALRPTPAVCAAARPLRWWARPTEALKRLNLRDADSVKRLNRAIRHLGTDALSAKVKERSGDMSSGLSAEAEVPMGRWAGAWRC